MAQVQAFDVFGMLPPSDHQDDITCLAKDSYKPSFLTVTRRGTSQRILVDIDPSLLDKENDFQVGGLNPIEQ